jgi:N-acetylglucosamine-6-phosphate deacetylase
VIKVVMKVKGDRAMLVSDAVALAGMPAGTYFTPVGGNVVLTPAGRTHLAGNEKLLAGSAQMLPWHIEHLVRANLADFSQAWEMASIRPARFMGLACAAGLRAGAPADFVLLHFKDGRIGVKATYKAGRVVYADDGH